MEKILDCVFTVIIYSVLEAIIAWGFQGLWNWLIPSLFHGPTLTYWEAFGLMVLLGFIASFFRSTSK